DAFAGLRIMDELAAKKKLTQVGSAALRGVLGSAQQRSIGGTATLETVEARKPAAVRVRPDLPRRSPTLPKATSIPKAPFYGLRTASAPMEAVFPYINELTLFSTQWQFVKGGADRQKYAADIENTARPALARLKDFCLTQNILRPSATYGFFPAAAEDDGQTIALYAPDQSTVLQRFTFPRQEFGDFLCLADYVEPLVDGRPIDSVALMAVTVGPEVTLACNRLKEEGKFQDYLFLHGLGVEAAEAYAEYFHKQLRAEWGIGDIDSPIIQKLFKGHYRGRRYAFGYPACPNLDDQTGLFELIEPGRVGITLTEQFLLEPEQSTTAIVFHHPQAKYFNVERSAQPLEIE
ncbi:MAG: vitamin B12 dependent-methionine synthase activation domain-containing protein, partial [Gemmataceae bacterium]